MMLADFVGNAPIIKAVGNMFFSGQIPHAILLEGEKGLGKHTLATIIAGGALCGHEHPPCGICRDCRLAQKGIHPDLLTIAPEGASIKVEQIRRLRQDVYILPNQAARRVFIIDGADKMNDSAANAMLKILEEPPTHAMFLLIAQSAEKLLSTIVSRCITLFLSPPEEGLGAEYIFNLGLDYKLEDVRSALSVSGGNIGLALELLENGNSEWEFTDRILKAAESGSELDLLRLLYTLEGKKGRERIHLVFNELQGKIERLISIKASGKQPEDSYAGKNIPLVRLLKMREGIMTATEQNYLNAGISLLLTNLCACFKVSFDV